MKFFKHLILITKHRHQVIKNASHLGIFFHSLRHDLSKYTYLEFNESYKRYQGNMSPVFVQRKDNENYSTIAVHHTSRNKHHWEYYTDFYKGKVLVCNMPYKYCLEYVADTLAASKIYDKKNFNGQVVLEYFRNRVSNYLMTETTKKFIDWCLEEYALNGWKALNKKRTLAKYKELEKTYPKVKEYQTMEIKEEN